MQQQVQEQNSPTLSVEEYEQQAQDYAQLAAMWLNTASQRGVGAADVQAVRSHVSAEHEFLTQLSELAEAGNTKEIKSILSERESRLSALPNSTKQFFQADSELKVLADEASFLGTQLAKDFNVALPTSPRDEPQALVEPVEASEAPANPPERVSAVVGETPVEDTPPAPAPSDEAEPAKIDAATSEERVEQILPAEPVAESSAELTASSVEEGDSTSPESDGASSTQQGELAAQVVEDKPSIADVDPLQGHLFFSMPESSNFDSTIVGPGLDGKQLSIQYPDEDSSEVYENSGSIVGAGIDPQPDSETTAGEAAEVVEVVPEPQGAADEVQTEAEPEGDSAAVVGVISDKDKDKEPGGNGIGEQGEKKGFIKRHPRLIGAAAIILTAAGAFFALRGVGTGAGKEGGETAAALVEGESEEGSDVASEAPGDLATDTAEDVGSESTELTEASAEASDILSPVADLEATGSESLNLAEENSALNEALQVDQTLVDASRNIATEDQTSDSEDFIPESPEGTDATSRQAEASILPPFSDFIPESAPSSDTEEALTDSQIQASPEEILPNPADNAQSIAAENQKPDFESFIPEDSQRTDSARALVETQNTEPQVVAADAAKSSAVLPDFTEFLPAETEAVSTSALENAELDVAAETDAARRSLRSSTLSDSGFSLEDFAPEGQHTAVNQNSADTTDAFKIAEYNADGTRKIPGQRASRSPLGSLGLGFDEFSPSTGENLGRNPYEQQNAAGQEYYNNERNRPGFNGVPGPGVIINPNPGPSILPGHFENFSVSSAPQFNPPVNNETQERKMFQDDLTDLASANFAPRAEEAASEEERPFRDTLAGYSSSDFSPNSDRANIEANYALSQIGRVKKLLGEE